MHLENYVHCVGLVWFVIVGRDYIAHAEMGEIDKKKYYILLLNFSISLISLYLLPWKNEYYTSTKFQYLFNFTIFTDPENTLNFI